MHQEVGLPGGLLATPGMDTGTTAHTLVALLAGREDAADVVAAVAAQLSSPTKSSSELPPLHSPAPGPEMPARGKPWEKMTRQELQWVKEHGNPFEVAAAHASERLEFDAAVDGDLELTHAVVSAGASRAGAGSD